MKKVIIFFSESIVVTGIVLANFSSNAQQVDIRKLVDSFCLCDQQAKSIEEQNNCLKILEPLRQVKTISIEDSLYILSVKGNCGSTKRVRKCNFLQESDLSPFHLKKYRESYGEVEWLFDKNFNQNLISISDQRERFKNEAEAELSSRTHKERTDEFIGLTLLLKDSVFNAEIYSSEWIDNQILYHVFIRGEDLTGYVLLLFKTKDEDALMKLFEKIIMRMKECLDPPSKY